MMGARGPHEIDYSLYAIADLSVMPAGMVVERAVAAVRGGATVVQLRGKKVTAGQLLAVADELVAALPVPVIVNDRVDVAALSGAAGVHVGDEDLPIEQARRLLETDLVGRTARTPDGARLAVGAGAAYLGVGSVYASGTKGGLPVIGVGGLREVCAVVERPVVAIGGIDVEGAAACIAAGAAGVAVVGALFGGDATPTMVEERAARLRAVIDARR